MTDEQLRQIEYRAKERMERASVFSAADLLLDAGLPLTFDTLFDAEREVIRRTVQGREDYDLTLSEFPEAWTEDGYFVFHPVGQPDVDIESAQQATRAIVSSALGLVDPERLSPRLQADLHLHLHGRCFPLAVALHRLTGYPYRLLLDLCGYCDSPTCSGACTVSVHAMVQTPCGRFMDAAGVRALPEILACYPVHAPHVVEAAEENLHEYSNVLGEPEIRAAVEFLRDVESHPVHRARQGGDCVLPATPRHAG